MGPGKIFAVGIIMIALLVGSLIYWGESSKTTKRASLSLCTYQAAAGVDMGQKQ